MQYVELSSLKRLSCKQSASKTNWTVAYMLFFLKAINYHFGLLDKFGNSFQIIPTWKEEPIENPTKTPLQNICMSFCSIYRLLLHFKRLSGNKKKRKKKKKKRKKKNILTRCFYPLSDVRDFHSVMYKTLRSKGVQKQFF